MNGALPDWLPSLIDTNGTWDDILGRLYAVFENDFKQGTPTFKGAPVRWDRRCPDADSHEEGFWHLVTRVDKATSDRLIDPPRAQRLGWCRAVIDNCGMADVLVFDYAEGKGKVRTYLWGHQFDYVVILERRKSRKRAAAYFLVTAFCLDGPSRRRAMQRKYDNRIT